MPLTRSAINGTSQPGNVKVMASMPRRLSLCPIPRTKDDPITATLGPVSLLPDVIVWPEPESDMGRLGIFDGGTRGRNGAGSLGVTADGVSRAGDDLVVFGRRRRPFETVWKPLLSLSPELNETINADTDLSTWSLSPCNFLITLSVSGRLSASRETLVWDCACEVCLVHSSNSFLAATKQLYERFSPSVCPSVRPSVCLTHLFDYVPIIVSSWNFQVLLPVTKVTSMKKVKVRGQRSRSQRSQPNLTVSGL